MDTAGELERTSEEKEDSRIKLAYTVAGKPAAADREGLRMAQTYRFAVQRHVKRS
jgi:hypothetical protein